MNLLLNGELCAAPDSVTLVELLDRLGLPAMGIAVERNRKIVPRSAYGVTCLTEGDQIEIVQFVGGG